MKIQSSDSQPQWSRRTFIKLAGAGMGAIYFGGCSSLFIGRTLRNNIGDASPFDRTLGEFAPPEFSGDNPSIAHRALRNKIEFLESLGGTASVPTQEVDVTVVGGGIAGLSSAYFLRDLNPVILEQAPRFGGNSRGESWRGSDYSIGAAYMGMPEPGSAVDKLFKDLGLDQKLKRHQESDPIYAGNRVHKDPWETGTCPANQKQFKKLGQYFTEVNEHKNGRTCPIIPIPENDILARSRINELDLISFESHLETVLGEKLHPDLASFFEQYCFSAHGGSPKEISAACGLAFFAGDFGGIVVASGGNAVVAQALYQANMESLGPNRMRPSSLVIDVQVQKDAVLVVYLNAEGKLQALRSKTVMMCCPKFVAKKIIQDL